MYREGNPVEIQTPTLEPGWPQHDSPAACVMAKQYFSATFISLCFYSCKEKFSACFKNVIIFIFIYVFLK
jgi:hypothetical protein